MKKLKLPNPTYHNFQSMYQELDILKNISLFLSVILFTDNIFSSKSWIKSKFSFDTSVIDKQFGIPEDFDYID